MADTEKALIIKSLKTTKQLGTILSVIFFFIIAAGAVFFISGNTAAAAALGGASLFFIIPGAGSLYRAHLYMVDIRNGSVHVIEHASLDKRTVTMKNCTLYNLYYGKTEFSVDKDMYERIIPDITVSVIIAPRSKELLAVRFPNGECIMAK